MSQETVYICGFTFVATATVRVALRGTDKTSSALFSYFYLEERIPANHPLRKIRRIVNDARTSLDADFDVLHTDFGRPCHCARARDPGALSPDFFPIRSARQLMEQMDCNLLLRWFVGLGIDDPFYLTEERPCRRCGGYKRIPSDDVYYDCEQARREAARK